MVRLTRKHAWAALAIIFLTLILWVLSKHWGNLLNLAGMLVIGIIIAYLLTPLCDLLERKLPRAAAITLILLMVCSALAAFALLFIPRMVREALALVDRFPMIMESVQIILGNLQNHMETMGIPKGIQSSVAAYADELQQKTTDTVMRFLEKTISGISVLPALFIELVLGFYFLKDRDYFGRVLTNLIPLAFRRKILQVASEVNHILHCFIRGEVFIAGIVGILATVGYAAIGLPYALILGFLAGLLEFIPYFGPWLGAIPALLVAWLAGSHKFIWTLAVILLIQQLENVFITPRILGGVVNLHPVYIILSLWTGGMFFGIVGMFLAVPAVLILRVLFKHIYLSIVAIK
ncbi:MAG: AI-2E family transporter [Caldicoprobacterales bacterium]|jgi:predicted PurR-regulated permease PerM|nr:AI-2E family transporter [Clostridiales bacterium]